MPVLFQGRKGIAGADLFIQNGAYCVNVWFPVNAHTANSFVRDGTCESCLPVEEADMKKKDDRHCRDKGEHCLCIFPQCALRYVQQQTSPWRCVYSEQRSISAWTVYYVYSLSKGQFAV